MIDAARRLTKHPLQTLLAFVVLGAGLGAVTFCLSLVNGLVLRPLPFANAERIQTIGYAREDGTGVAQMLGGDFLRLAPALRDVDAVAAYGLDDAYVRQGEENRRYSTTFATHDLLSVLGVQPTIGRAFGADDDRPSAAPVALLSHRVWRQDYRGEEVLGRTIEVNGETTTVVGVLPPGFEFPYDSGLMLPARLEPGSQRDVNVLVLLPTGASESQMRSIVEAAAAEVGNALDGMRAGRSIVSKPIAYLFVDENVRTYVMIMLIASLLVLAIACADTSNLQLMQALARQQEIAIRAALGAPRSALIRDVLVESLLLSLGATVIALLVANFASDWIVRMFVDNGQPPPYFIHFGIDLRLLLMTLAIAVFATGLAGLWPALQATRIDLTPLLHDGNKGSSGSWSRTASTMVVAGVALTTILLSGAAASLFGLGGLARSDVGTGTTPSAIVTGTMELHASQFPDGPSRSQFLLRVVERLRADPAVVSASASTTLPGAILGSHEYIGARGAARPDGGYPRAQMGAIDRGFLATYGIALRDGLELTRFVEGGRRDVAIVDTTTADQLWPGRSPIGQVLLLNPDRPTPDAVEVVGVIDPLQLDSVLASRLPTVLVPIERFPRSAAVIAVRTRGDPRAFAPRMTEIVRAESSHVVLSDVSTQAAAIDRARFGAVVLTRTFGALGLIALLLAVGGLYALISLSVARRSREIGIVRALGARGSDVVSLIMGRIGLHVLTGLLVGGFLAVPISRVLADPGTPLSTSLFTVCAVAALIVIVGAASALQPMLRALRIDPLAAMQQE